MDNQDTKVKSKRNIFPIILLIIAIIIIAIGILISMTNSNGNNNSKKSSKSNLSGHRIISVADLNNKELEEVYKNLDSEMPKFGKLVLGDVSYTNKIRISPIDDNYSFYDLKFNSKNMWILHSIDYKTEWYAYAIDDEYKPHLLSLMHSFNELGTSETDYTKYQNGDWSFNYSTEGVIYGNYKLEEHGYLSMKFEDNQLNKEENIKNFIDMFCKNIDLTLINAKEDTEMHDYIMNVFSVDLKRLNEDKYSDLKINDKYSLNLKNNNYIVAWGTLKEDENALGNKIIVRPYTYEYLIQVIEYLPTISLDDIKERNKNFTYSNYQYNGIDMILLTVAFEPGSLLENLNGSFGGFIIKIDDSYYYFSLDSSKVKELKSKSTDDYIKYIFDNFLITK